MKLTLVCLIRMLRLILLPRRDLKPLQRSGLLRPTSVASECCGAKALKRKKEKKILQTGSRRGQLPLRCCSRVQSWGKKRGRIHACPLESLGRVPRFLPATRTLLIPCRRGALSMWEQWDKLLLPPPVCTPTTLSSTPQEILPDGSLLRGGEQLPQSGGQREHSYHPHTR